MRSGTRHIVFSSSTSAAPRRSLRVHASSSATSAKQEQPAWTGESLLSSLVNVLIATKPLYAIMKIFAKNAMKTSAAKKGVAWDEHVQQLQADPELAAIKAELEQPGLAYPPYYLQPFHAYEDGNLNWLAAYEVDPASYAMAVRTFKDKEWTAQQSFDVLRRGVTDAWKAYHAAQGVPLPATILDVGCSTGLNTRFVAEQFPEATITGYDASPYFLAVAEREERRKPAGAKRIKYMHGVIESNPFAPASFDMVAFQFVIHECPQQAIRDFVTEGKRLVKPGGVLTFVDNDPRSKTIQNLPPALFTLMKSTEPWSDEYYSFDLEAAMREAGFKAVTTVATDHRHRAVMGVAP